MGLGLDAGLWRQRLKVNFRLNWVGAKETGPGTTVDSNPLSEIDGYTSAHLSLRVRDVFARFRAFPETHLDLTVNNLFDQEIYHPGIRTASGDIFASRVPQPEGMLSES